MAELEISTRQHKSIARSNIVGFSFNSFLPIRNQMTMHWNSLQNCLPCSFGLFNLYMMPEGSEFWCEISDEPSIRQTTCARNLKILYEIDCILGENKQSLSARK